VKPLQAENQSWLSASDCRTLIRKAVSHLSSILGQTVKHRAPLQDIDQLHWPHLGFKKHKKTKIASVQIKNSISAILDLLDIFWL
jgi:hypothetical protein